MITVAVLMGGPDAEHAVSLDSGRAVATALGEHHDLVVTNVEIGRSTRDELAAIEADVFFPVLHGPWGEGGPLQQLLELDGRPFVGWRAHGAEAAMDKHHTKQVALDLGLMTPPWERLPPGAASRLDPPVVIKPVAEGSSLELHIARTLEEREAALARLASRQGDVLIERFIEGRELTVGIIEDNTLPIIEITAASGVYDYQAKYHRDDTRYTVDPELPAGVEAQLRKASVCLHHALGGRHLSRVDFLLDQAGPWLLEINTMPGFTTHSLLPMAAVARGWDMPDDCRRLVQLALTSHGQTPRPASSTRGRVADEAP
jgi:D-alanine-D-alanine ligase